MGNITDCIVDGDRAELQFARAIKAFEKKNFMGAERGIKLTGEAISELSTTIQECETTKADKTQFKRLEIMVKSWKHPRKLIFHVGKDLLVNGVDIFSEIADAMVQYHKKNYMAFGSDLGEAIVKTFLAQNILPEVQTEEQALFLW